MSTILVTGAAGFIGSNFVRRWLEEEEGELVALDLLTYAGRLANLAEVLGDPRVTFVQGDICHEGLVRRLLAEYTPRAIVHLAAETHVDRSIRGPGEFVRTNVTGTFTLLQASLEYWRTLEAPARDAFRFLHVSTDEVYGALGPTDPPFREDDRYVPSSPYSASKAAADHLVRAWHHTYGLPAMTTHCSNNYGPHQFPEKLIPVMLHHALAGRGLPVYGDGAQVRDWLHVRDHCDALRCVLARGTPGRTYNVGGGAERTNLELVHSLCDLLDELRPDTIGPRRRLVKHVADRPGHDRRYAVDSRRITDELGWRPAHTLEAGLRETVRWYLAHPEDLEPHSR